MSRRPVDSRDGVTADGATDKGAAVVGAVGSAPDALGPASTQAVSKTEAAIALTAHLGHFFLMVIFLLGGRSARVVPSIAGTAVCRASGHDRLRHLSYRHRSSEWRNRPWPAARDHYSLPRSPLVQFASSQTRASGGFWRYKGSMGEEPEAIEPRFLTLEQTAQYLNVSADQRSVTEFCHCRRETARPAVWEVSRTSSLRPPPLTPR